MRSALGASLLTLALASCAVNPNANVEMFAQGTGENSFEMFNRSIDSPQAVVLPVVHDRQTSGPSCGAHALASVINYWRPNAAARGDAIYAATPPANVAGYSMAELLTLAQSNGLLANAVRLDRAAIIAELERGRPVLVPLRLPSIYVQQRTLPGAETPGIGFVRNALISRAARVSEFTRLAVVDHYLLIVGYDEDRWVVVEPVMGYRTITADRLERYRAHFNDAAIVFSANRSAQR